MNNVKVTRGEAILFIVMLIVPMTVEAVLALTTFPQLRWMLPTSLLFPAGLLVGIALRERSWTTR